MLVFGVDVDCVGVGVTARVGVGSVDSVVVAAVVVVVVVTVVVIVVVVVVAVVVAGVLVDLISADWFTLLASGHEENTRRLQLSLIHI